MVVLAKSGNAASSYSPLKDIYEQTCYGLKCRTFAQAYVSPLSESAAILNAVLKKCNKIVYTISRRQGAARLALPLGGRPAVGAAVRSAQHAVLLHFMPRSVNKSAD
jgi:hypothetical protein